MPPTDPRLANNAGYNTDNRTLGPPYESYNTTSQEPWASTNTQPNVPDYQKPYTQNDQLGAYGPSVPSGAQPPNSAYRLTRQDALPYQQNMDQSGQQFTNQGRRLSSAMRPGLNQNRIPAQQEWNTSQGPIRRQSVLGQPSHNTQDNSYVDGGTSAYSRNEYRVGTVASESTLDRQPIPVDPQGYRSTMDPQGYRQSIEQGYRQVPDQQMYRQQTTDSQGFRQPAQTEQEIVNGTRDGRAPGQRPSIDYFDHYKRPPSRDSSVDRYGRRSRQPSVEAAAPSSGSRAGSVAPQPAASSRPPSRAATPASNGHLASGRGSVTRASSREPQPFEESLLRKRNLGQDISPSPYQPKRTESLYVAPNPTPPPAPKPSGGGGGGGGGGGRKVSSLKLCSLFFQN